MKAKVNKSLYGYLFIAPFFLGYTLVGMVPILYTLYLSFTKWDGFSDPVFVGFANYKRLLHDSFFFQTIGNTLWIWVMSIVPQLLLALLLALFLNEKFIRGRHFFRAVFYFPHLISTVTLGVMFALMFDWQTGSVNKLLLHLGVIQDPINWFNNPWWSRASKLRAISDNSSPGGFWYIRENAKKWLGTDDPDQIGSMVDNGDKVVELGQKVAKDSGGKVHLIQSASSLFDIMAYNIQSWVKDGKLNIDPKWKETYDTQLKIRKEDVDAKLGFMSSGWGSALNNGDVVLTSMPSWASFMIDNKDGKAKGKFGVAKTPQGFYLGGRYEGIYDKSPNKKLAYEVLKFIASPDWQKYNLEQTGNMPGNAQVFDDNQDTFKSDMFGDQLILKTYADQMKAMPAMKPNKYDEAILSKWGKVAGEGINNNKSYDDVVAAFKTEVKNTYPELQVD